MRCKSKNPYYNNCKYQNWVFPTQPALCNSYASIKCMCKKFGVDVYTIHRNDDLPMCCVSLSPYTKQNCRLFTQKKNQTQLSEFGDE